MSKKRGGLSQEAILLIIAIVVSIGLYAMMQSYVNAQLGKNYLERLYLSRDQALLIDSLHTGQGNAFYNYSVHELNMKQFSYDYGTQRVKVTGAEQDPVTYRYADDKALGMLTASIPVFERSIPFAKDSAMHIGPYTNGLRCDYITPSKPLQDVKLLFDAGHGDDDGYTITEANTLIKEKVITGGIMFQFKTLPKQMRDISITRNSWYQDSGRLSQAEINGHKALADYVISVHTGLYSNRADNTIRAYINYFGNLDESRALACHITNELAQVTKMDIAIVPVDPEFDNDKQVLPKDKVGVFLEIGNMNNADSLDILKTKQKEIAEAIYKGIEDYHAR